MDMDHIVGSNRIQIDPECLGFSLKTLFGRNMVPHICNPSKLEIFHMERQTALYQSCTSIVDVLSCRSNLEMVHLDPGRNPN